MSKAKFTAELFEGHKDVHAVIVPFDPQEVWGQKPVKIDPRRDGWLIRGTMNNVRFLGWIGYRWGRFFIMVDPEMRETLGADVGAHIVFVVGPTNSEAAMKIAREQAKLTTAPGPRKKRRARLPRASFHRQRDDACVAW